MKPFTTIAVVVFALVALAHLYRLIHPFAVVVDGQVSRLRMLEEVTEGGEIQFVPAIHGGAW